MGTPRKTRAVYGLIAAAGKGTRLGAELPKAYVELRGKTLLERSIQAMITSGVVHEIIVVIAAEMQSHAEAILAKAQFQADTLPEIRFVHGRGERADSVWEGLQTIHDETGIVLIHDAARALTPPGMIARVARSVLDGATAVVPVLPVADTIKQVRKTSATPSTIITATPTRSELRIAQTPQGFDIASLKAANQAYFASETPSFQATDDASLMEWYGAEVSCVRGDPMALKITTPLDLALAETVTAQAEPTIFEVPDA